MLHTYEYYNNQWDLSLTKYYSGKPIEKNEIGGACSTYGGKKSCIDGLGGACSTYGGKESCIEGLDGEPEGKRTLGRPRGR